MKKSLIISTLFLCVSFFLSLSTKAQQQKKPSERSFAAEINKIKTIQATRNQKINQIQQQPTESATVPANTTTNAGQNQTNNTNTAPEKKQAAPAIKPSSGSMRPVKKPVASRG